MLWTVILGALWSLFSLTVIVYWIVKEYWIDRRVPRMLRDGGFVTIADDLDSIVSYITAPPPAGNDTVHVEMRFTTDPTPYERSVRLLQSQLKCGEEEPHGRKIIL